MDEPIIKLGYIEVKGRTGVSKVKSVLIEPRDHVPPGSTAVYISPGVLGDPEKYIEPFGKQIGARWPTYIVELQNKGLEFGGSMLETMCQVDSTIRERLETDRLIHIGHSIGGSLQIELAKRPDKKVRANVCLATYPSIGDILNPQADPDKADVTQKIINNIAPNMFISVYPLRQQKSEKPVLFVLPTDDRLLYTTKTGIERFRRFYKKNFPNSHCLEFPGNHIFNDGTFNWFTDFNKDHPDALLNAVKLFIERIE